MTHKKFFEWMRAQQADNKLTQSMVDGANEMLAYMQPDELQEALGKVNGWASTTMSLSEAGSDFIKGFEAYVGKPYKDAVGVWTIGYGNTYYPDGRKVSGNDAAISEAAASKLKQDIINQDFAPAVNVLFADEIAKGELSQGMFDALVSLAYNIGTRGLAGSSVARHIKSGNYAAAADAFLLWNKGRVNGKLVELRGLTRRREGERAMFLG